MHQIQSYLCVSRIMRFKMIYSKYTVSLRSDLDVGWRLGLLINKKDVGDEIMWLTSLGLCWKRGCFSLKFYRFYHKAQAKLIVGNEIEWSAWPYSASFKREEQSSYLVCVLQITIILSSVKHHYFQTVLIKWEIEQCCINEEKNESDILYKH